MNSLRFPKPQRLESDEYLKFVRTHACLIHQCWRRTQAHHVVFDGQGRTGSKVADYQTIPLCDKHHREFHEGSRESFESKHALNLYQVIIDLLIEFIVMRDSDEKGLPI